MVQDSGWKSYFSDDARYADVINGLGCNGRQAVAAEIRRKVRKNASGLSAGEYLYGFRKDSRMYPAVTFILYSGVEPWDGPTSLHEMLELHEIPEDMRSMIPDYKINLIEIRKLSDTDVFKTDVMQVFDFIRCAEDKNALAQLVEKDSYYQHMEEDAFDVVVNYANATELAAAKEYYGKDGKVDMCTAIREMMADSRAEGIRMGREEGILAGREEGIRTGREEGIRAGREAGFDEKGIQVFINAVKRGMSEEDAKAIAQIDDTLVETARKRMRK